MMKNSIRVLAPRFLVTVCSLNTRSASALPIADRYERLAENDFAKARELSEWKTRMRDAWCDVKVTGFPVRPYLR